MAIQVTCPHCAHHMKVPDEFAGRKGRCPNCQQVFVAPANRPAAPAPRAAGGSRVPPAPLPTPAQRQAAAPSFTPVQQPEPAQAATLPSEDDGALPEFSSSQSTTTRVYYREKNRRKKELPVWLWVLMVGGGAGVLMLVLGLVIVLSNSSGGGGGLSGGGGGWGLGGGSSAAADPDAGFDSSTVSVPAPHPIRTASNYIVPPEHLEDAVGVCQSFRFIPANQEQYAWMQVLARYLASFEWELEQEPFRGTPERKAQLQRVVQSTLAALDQVKFTERRIAAVNKQAEVAFDSQFDNHSLPLFVFGNAHLDAGSSTWVLTVKGWYWGFGMNKSTNFTRSHSENCRYMFVGYVLTNDLMEVRSRSGLEDIVLFFRTYHVWAEEGSGAIAIPDG